MEMLEFDPIVLWGAGSQALVLDELIKSRRMGERVVALLSDYAEVSPLEGVPVISGDQAVRQWLEQGTDNLLFSVAIGSGHGAARLAKIDFLAAYGLTPKTLIHRTATALSDDFGRACQILAGSIVGVKVSLGDGVILNTGAQVDHECRLEHGVHVGPGAVLAGRVTVGARTFIGAGVTVCPDLRIAPDCIIGAGAVVTKDIREPGTYVGVPARLIKGCSER